MTRINARIQKPKRAGHPEGYPRPDCALYALASLRALAAEVKRDLLPLLARLGVDHDLAYCHPAAHAGVRAQTLEASVVRLYSAVALLSR
jgi:hypothetical protein